MISTFLVVKAMYIYVHGLLFNVLPVLRESSVHSPVSPTLLFSTVLLDSCPVYLSRFSLSRPFLSRSALIRVHAPKTVNSLSFCFWLLLFLIQWVTGAVNALRSSDYWSLCSPSSPIQCAVFPDVPSPFSPTLSSSPHLSVSCLLLLCDVVPVLLECDVLLLRPENKFINDCHKKTFFIIFCSNY